MCAEKSLCRVPKVHSADDSTLMARLAAGNLQALGILYERHAGFVYRVAYRFLGNEEDARDITQSVFVTILQSARRYRPEARLTSWIYRIVVNRCFNQRSKASRRLRRFPGDRVVEQMPDDQKNQPDQLLDLARQKARLLAAISRLPRRQRMALILSRFEGQSYEQIAASLGCTKSSVESLLFRARRALEKSFFK